MRRARPVLVLVLLVVAAAALAWLAAPPDTSGCAWEPAPNVHFDGPYRATVRTFRDLEQQGMGTLRDPDLFGVRMDRAWAAEEAGDWPRALELWRALQADTRSALRLRRGVEGLVRALNAARERVDLLGAAGAPPAGPALALHLRGRRALEHGDAAAARAAFQAVLDDPAAAALHPFAGLGRAAVPFQQGDVVAAISLLQPLLAAPPHPSVTPRTLFLLARAQVMRGDPEALKAAAEAAARLLEAFPQDDLADDALGMIGRVRCLEERFDDARDAYERLLEKFPDGDLVKDAEESLLYTVYPRLVRAGSPRRPLPAAVTAYLGCLAKLGPPASGSIWLDAESDRYRTLPVAALAGGVVEEAPAWLRDNILYRLLRRDVGLRSVRAIFWFRRLLDECPRSDRVPVSLYLMGSSLYGGARADAPIEGFIAMAPTAAARRAYGRGLLLRLAREHPASEYAPRALRLLLAEARGAVEEREAVATLAAAYERLPAAGAWADAFADLSEDRRKLLGVSAAAEAALFFAGENGELLTQFPEGGLAGQALVLAFDELEGRWSERRNADARRRALEHHRAEGRDREAEEEGHEPAAEPAVPLEEAATRLMAAAERWLATHQGRTGSTLVRLQAARAALYLGRAADTLAACEQILAGGREAAAGRIDEVLWLKTRALAVLGRPAETAATVAELARAAPHSPLLANGREEAAIAWELAGDPAEALSLYLDLGYVPDTAYLLDVVMTRPEIERWLERHPADPQRGKVAYSLALRRLRAEDFAGAREALGRAAGAGLVKEAAEKAAEVNAMEVAWRTASEARRPSAPETPDRDARVARLLAELGDDDPAVRERATADLIALGRGAAVRVRTGLLSADPEVRVRVRRILEEIAADPGSAAYAYAKFLFERDALFVNEVAWQYGRIEYLASQEALLRPEEAERLRAFQEEYNVKVRARRLFREVAEAWPDSPKAAAGLYMAGVAGLRLFDYNALYRGNERLIEGARADFLELARRYPASPLADDALFWAGFWSKDEKATAELYDRIRREYPTGDVMQQVLGPSAATDTPNPSRAKHDEELLRRFKEHNRALRGGEGR